MNKFGLLQRDIDYILQGIKLFPEIEKALIFGSRANGTFKKGSDIDIAIFGEKVNSRTLSELNDKLNEEFPIPYFVDIIHFETINNEKLKLNILENAQKLTNEIV